MPCICHLDCDYCGKEGTIVLIAEGTVTAGLLGKSFPTDLNPQPLSYIGTCSNCGYKSPKPPVDAVPVEDLDFDEA